MADVVRLVAGSVLMLCGTSLLYLLAVLEFERASGAAWYLRPPAVAIAAVACILAGVSLVR